MEGVAFGVSSSVRFLFVGVFSAAVGWRFLRLGPLMNKRQIITENEINL